MANTQYLHAYSPPKFWAKAARYAGAAGRGTLEKALWLYYAAQSASTPAWARRVIYGALGYFIFPLDAIPDLAPLVGYTDDLSVMAAALVTVSLYITPEVKAQARDTLARWFGSPNAPANNVAQNPAS